MKQPIIKTAIAAVCLVSFQSTPALAIICQATACGGEYYDLNPSAARNCANVQRTCYCSEAVVSCPFCNGGCTKTQSSLTTSGGQTVKYYYCKENCVGCSNCTSDSDWSAHSTGYQKKTTRSCDCNTCNATTAYRCASGYYGTSTNGTSGCTRCPSSGGVYGTSSAGSTVITACYLPSGTTGSDSTGAFTYTNNCYYSN